MNEIPLFSQNQFIPFRANILTRIWMDGLIKEDDLTVATYIYLKKNRKTQFKNTKIKHFEWN